MRLPFNPAPPDDAITISEMCEQWQKGQVIFGDNPNPCVDTEANFIIFAMVAIALAIGIALWSLSTGIGKGYGVLASLTTNPLLLRELPDRTRSSRATPARPKRATTAKKGRTTGRRKGA